MGGHNIPMKRYQNLFDCLVTSQDDRAIQNAMDTASQGSPSHTRARLHHRGIITLALIRVDLLDPHYLLAGWKLPDNLIPYPFTRYALC